MSVSRRSVLSFLVGGALGTLVTPIPWKLQDDSAIWTQNWPWIPRLEYGKVGAKPSISKAAGEGAPVMITTRDGYPVTTMGNKANPLSRGGLDALAASEVKLMFSPARVQQPMKKDGAGSFQPISWEEAEQLLVEKLEAAGPRVGCVSGDPTGSANEVLAGLLKGLGSTTYFLMPTDEHVQVKAWQGLMGGVGIPGYDIENADAVLMIGADCFECWGPTVRNRKAFDTAKPTDGKSTTTFAYAGPVQNRTAAVCDSYIGIKPGTEGIFAMGVASLLPGRAGAASIPGMVDFQTLTREKFSPEKVASITGASVEQIKEAASLLTKAKRPLVIAGSPIYQGSSATTFIAGMGINLMLGRLNRPGGVYALPEQQPVVSGAPQRSTLLAGDLVTFLSDVAAGEAPTPDVMLVYEANPAFSLPQAEAMAQALDTVPFLVSMTTYMDETAAMADLILPNPLSLERYEDMATPYGLSYSAYLASEPVTKPAFDAKSAADVALAVAPKLGVDLGFASFKDVVKAKADQLAASGFMASKKAPWEAVAQGYGPNGGGTWKGLMDGDAWVDVQAVSQYSLVVARHILEQGLQPPAEGLLLTPMVHSNIGSQKMAIPPHNAVTIRDDILDDDGMYVHMAKATADTIGVRDGGRVKVSTDAGEIVAKVAIDEGVVEGVVAAPLFLGHTAWDKFSKGKGENVFKLLAVGAESGTKMPVWDAQAVSVSKA
jgi:anaerobic selenocysteine-containing dehydrogenase